MTVGSSYDGDENEALSARLDALDRRALHALRTLEGKNDEESQMKRRGIAGMLYMRYSEQVNGVLSKLGQPDVTGDVFVRFLRSIERGLCQRIENGEVKSFRTALTTRAGWAARDAIRRDPGRREIPVDFDRVDNPDGDDGRAGSGAEGVVAGEIRRNWEQDRDEASFRREVTAQGDAFAVQLDGANPPRPLDALVWRLTWQLDVKPDEVAVIISSWLAGSYMSKRTLLLAAAEFGPWPLVLAKRALDANRPAFEGRALNGNNISQIKFRLKKEFEQYLVDPGATAA